MKIRSLFALLLTVCFFSALHADYFEDIFTDVYNRGEWGRNEEGQGHSGEGSTEENTRIYRCFLEQFLASKQIKSVVDLGCGDWQFSKLINWDGINYTGIDVVKHVIDKNQALYSAPNINFIHSNGLFNLPEADLIICKDVLQHLPNEIIALFLPQLSRYKHCLITNCVNPDSLTSDNPNIFPGHYRLLDLTKPPFNIPGRKILTFIAGSTTKQVLYIYNPR